MKQTTKRLLSVMICLVMVIAMLPVGAFAADTTTVYCQTPANWTGCKAYWWGSTGTNPGWPGVDMTKAEDGIWTYDVPSDAAGLIFNNGSGSQSKDLTVPTTDEVMFVYATGKWATYGKVEVETAYYVAGTAGLCGVAWSPNAAENKLTDSDGDGVYTITFKNVAAGKQEFKVTDGTWDTCWPNDNYVLNLDAVSDVTIAFNTADGNIAVDVVPVKDPVVTEPTEPAPVVYTVAGFAALCGSDWNPADMNNLMADPDGDGIYTITYANVAAGSYEFKVTNGTWDSAWPSDNYVLNVGETSDVTIVFNTADQSVNVVFGSEVPPSEPSEVIYTVAGVESLCGSGWNPGDLNNLMADPDGDGIYTITYANVAAGSYEFKVTNGTWDSAWPSENYILNIAEATDVTISFNPADGSIQVSMGNDVAVYIVAGQDTLCGSNWDATDPANQMTDADGDGIYTLTYTDVPAGDYMFKVTQGTWDKENWGGDGTDGNYVFRLWAKSNVTIKFNPETGIITLDIQELEAPVEPSVPEVTETFYYVAGNMNGWNACDAAYIMNDQEDGTYTLTLAVVAGDYELKVTDGTWDNSWGGEGGNYIFKAYTDGEVVVTFDTNTYTVSVTGDCLNEPVVEPEPLTIYSMHVAGMEGLCGVNWDPTANQMDCAMGIYSITFTNVAAGTYEFKFAANGEWTYDWASGIEMPSGETQTAWFKAQGNSSVVVAEDGSTVTLTFDMTTMDIFTGEGATSCVVVEAPAAPEAPAVELNVGDQIIIYALESDVALSTTQNSNNRGQAVIVKNEGTISFGDDVQVITLVEGTVPGTFGFQVGEGQYLYAASSKSNHLKATDTLDDNGSWAIVIDATTGEATITASGENTRNLLRYNKASSLFSCYGSGQQAVAVYKITGEEPEPPVVKDLELEPGNNSLVLNAGDLGDTWTFVAPEAGTLTINPLELMADNGMGELEAVPAEYLGMVLSRQFALQINGETVFEYPVELTVAEGDEVTVYFASGMRAPAELILNMTLVPPVVEEPEAQGATLVTDVTSLKVGDQIIIVAQDYDKSISATLKNNNRDAVDVVKNGNTVAFGDDVQIITLVAGTVPGTFGFQVGEGQYLYAASSKSNYLKLTDTLDDNGSWSITVDENGELAVVASGENTRNILRYNTSSNLFSCYASGQAPVCIYKIAASEEPAGNELVLGDNELTLEAGDIDGDSWTFTATEDGALFLTVTALAYDWMGEGEYTEAPANEIPFGFNRMYNVLINGMWVDIFNESYTVNVGDVITVEISSRMGYATKLTLNLSIGEPPVVEPSEPGSWDNPIVIESMPFELTVDGSHDIYYIYVAEKDGTLVITATEGNLVSLANYDKVGSTYYVTVTAGEEISINPWGEVPGTYTMSYGEAPSEETVELKFEYPTVSYKEEFLLNIYFSGVNMDKVVKTGMITFSSEVADYTINNAENVYVAKYSAQDDLYRATTKGISAKNMGDVIWMALYAELEDGTYVYTKLVSYSPAQYAYSLIGYIDSAVDSLMVAMLNYGAAAQVYFGYNTDNLVNKDLTAEQKALVADFNSDMVTTSSAVPVEKQGVFANNNGFTDKYPRVSFKGTFVINYYGTATANVVGPVTLYYWDAATFAANDVLTVENATGSMEMIGNGNGGYVGSVSGIAARKLNTTVYVAFVYSDGTTVQTSGVLPYSIGEYCGAFAGTSDVFAPMAEATAVYGYYAKAYFG